MLSDNIIRSFSGTEISYEEFLIALEALNDKGLNVYIGTDSQGIRKDVSIVTSVCFYKHGIQKNQIFYVKRRLDRNLYPTLRSRMLLEAYSSLEAAMELDPLVSGKLTVHLDIGTDSTKSKTAKLSSELKMLFKAQGFGCEVKPDSWASSCVADRWTKS